jgi:hypothetical protein
MHIIRFTSVIRQNTDIFTKVNLFIKFGVKFYLNGINLVVLTLSHFATKIIRL